MKENKEKKMTKNQKTSIIVLLLLLVTVISATYAYFTAQRGSGGSAEINVEAGTTDSLIFDNGDAITIDANSDNFAKGKGNRDGETEVRAHLVANNTNNTATEQYYVYLNIEKNPFVYTNSDTPELVLQVIDPDGQELDAIDGLTPVTIESTEEDGSQIKGFDITTTSGLVAIKKMYTISASPNEEDPLKNGKTDHTWKIKIILVNLDQDQQVNTGKTFKAQAIVSHNTIPKVNLSTTDISNTSLKAIANITDYDGKISEVDFQIDGDEEWHQGALESIQGLDLEASPIYSYTFEGLEAGKNYEISTKVIYENNPELLNTFNIKTIKNYTLADACPTEDLLNTCIEKLSSDYLSSKSNLYHHTISLDNSANDNSYRYAGDDPNNYVCFGEGSENYNQGEDTVCPDTNLYRIIGLFGNQVKLIKSEYIKKSELGIGDRDYGHSTKELSVNSSYENITRIKNKTGNYGFYWYGEAKASATNNWEISLLNEALNNSDETHYLGKLGATWADKIVETTWHIGSQTEYKINAKAMYESEQALPVSSAKKIGLMYLSDYGFASSPDNWTLSLNGSEGEGYRQDANRNNNWLFTGINEWTILSANASIEKYANFITDEGSIYNTSINMNANGVRPVFYLNDTVKVNTTGTDGSMLKPFKIA